MSEKFVLSENMKIMHVYVSQYGARNLSGTIYHDSLTKTGIRFDSTLQFVLGMNQIMDMIYYPREKSVYRTFCHAQGVVLSAGTLAEKEQRGALAIFHICVMFRQHTSWQGSIIWSDGSSKMMFRSVLELVLLMDSALTSEASSFVNGDD